MTANNERVLRYYYKHRKEEQVKRWKVVIDKVYEMKDNTKDDIADELTKSGFRILKEDIRATERKIKNGK